MVDRASADTRFDYVTLDDYGAMAAATRALVASNSDLALAILRILPRARLRCPDDVSLLAFDAAPWADVLTPPLAVVRQPTQLLARRAWQVLGERMHARHARPQRIMLSATLDLRASVAAPPSAIGKMQTMVGHDPAA